jgi:hypothetical protein
LLPQPASANPPASNTPIKAAKKNLFFIKNSCTVIIRPLWSIITKINPPYMAVFFANDKDIKPNGFIVLKL